LNLAKGTEQGQKKIFYRAVRRVPWAKVLWLDAVSKLRINFFKKELDDLIELMGDKELRLRTDLREVDLLEQFAK